MASVIPDPIGNLLLKESSYDFLSLCKSGLKVVVDKGIVEFSFCKLHLGRGLVDSLGYRLHRIRSAADEPFAENLHRRSLDEYGKSLVSEDPLQVYASLDIDVEDYRMALCPDALYLGSEGSVV